MDQKWVNKYEDVRVSRRQKYPEVLAIMVNKGQSLYIYTHVCKNDCQRGVLKNKKLVCMEVEAMLLSPDGILIARLNVREPVNITHSVNCSQRNIR